MVTFLFGLILVGLVGIQERSRENVTERYLSASPGEVTEHAPVISLATFNPEHSDAARRNNKHVGGTPFSSSPTKSKENVKIVGGDDIDITDAPYQVSIMYRGRHSCGGAIVGYDIVVTAAHCVSGSNAINYLVRAGSSSSTRGGQIVPVGELIWNPDFSYSKMDSDIAILWLSRPLVFSDSVQPVMMVEPGEEILNGELTMVTGWGNTLESGGLPSTLQVVLVPKINEQVCADAYQPHYSISPRMMCAGVPEGGKDACQGDSGGPLIHNGKLAGIVSWGLGCARPEYPGVYAKVSALRHWVDENITLLRMKHTLRAT